MTQPRYVLGGSYEDCAMAHEVNPWVSKGHCWCWMEDRTCCWCGDNSDEGPCLPVASGVPAEGPSQ